MPVRWSRAVLVLSAAAAAAAGAPVDPVRVVERAAPVAALHACAARSDLRGSGLPALENECPGLRAALMDLGYATPSNAAWQSRLTPTGLRDLSALAERYAGRRPGTAPDVVPLEVIVASLVRERAPPHSVWDDVRLWLRSLLERQDAGSLARLGRLLAGLEAAAGFAGYAVAALLLLLLAAAGVIIVRELRAAGVFARRPRTAADLQRRALAGGMPEAGWSLEAAALADQPAILLRLLIEVLSGAGRLPASAQLTHRELAALAVLDDADQRTRFARLAALAERLLYGPKTPPAEDLRAIVDEGRALLGQLRRSGAAA